MYLVLLEIMESQAKTGAICNYLHVTVSNEVEALVMTEAYCNFSNQDISDMKVA